MAMTVSTLKLFFDFGFVKARIHLNNKICKVVIPTLHIIFKCV